jgi:hypothetical protein
MNFLGGAVNPQSQHMHNRVQANNNVMGSSAVGSLSNGPEWLTTSRNLLGNPGDVDSCLAQSVSAMDCGDSIMNSTLTIPQGRSNIPTNNNVSAVHRQNSFNESVMNLWGATDFSAAVPQTGAHLMQPHFVTGTSIIPSSSSVLTTGNCPPLPTNGNNNMTNANFQSVNGMTSLLQPSMQPLLHDHLSSTFSSAAANIAIPQLSSAAANGTSFSSLTSSGNSSTLSSHPTTRAQS